MFGEFTILAVLDGGEVKRYLARHPAFKRILMLHVLPKRAAPGNVPLTDYLARISTDAGKSLLQRGTVFGEEYVATPAQPEFRNLREWLVKVSPGETGALPAPAVGAVSAVRPTPLPPAPASAPAGEFTRLFHTTPGAGPPEPHQPAQGDFTRMFGGAGPAQPAPAASGIEPAEPTAPKKPGKFTKEFMALLESGAAQLPAPPESAPPATDSRPAGSFTSLFESPVTPPPDPTKKTD